MTCGGRWRSCCAYVDRRCDYHRSLPLVSDYQWLFALATSVVVGDILYNLVYLRCRRCLGNDCVKRGVTPLDAVVGQRQTMEEQRFVETSVTQYWQLLVDAVIASPRVDLPTSEPFHSVTMFSASSVCSGAPSLCGHVHHRLVLPVHKCFTLHHSADPALSRTNVTGAGSDPWDWHVLYMLWTDAVRYSVNVYEIRALLLQNRSDEPDVARSIYSKMRSRRVRAVKGNSLVRLSSGQEFEQYAGVNLALLWYLELIRRVHESVIDDGDTQRCAEELEELDRYASILHKRWVAPLTEPRCSAHCRNAVTGVELTCAPVQCWGVLTTTLHRLRVQRRVRVLMQMRSLLRYMHTTSAPRFVAFVGMGFMTRLSARMTALGPTLHEAMQQLLPVYIEKAVALSKTPSCPSCETPAPLSCVAPPIAAQTSLRSIADQLILYATCEVLRFGLDAVLLQVTQQVIHTIAARRRERMKAALYNALTHLPLTFYDTHSYEEVEQMVYYTNDIEGVDVQFHRFLFSVGRAVVGMRCGLVVLPPRARLCVVGAVVTSVALGAAGRLVGRWYRNLCDTRKGVTRDEVENRDSAREVRRDGILLRGLEIVAALPQLRPYGADVTLMRWWNAHSARFDADGVFSGDHNGDDEDEDRDYGVHRGRIGDMTALGRMLRRFVRGPMRMWMEQLHARLWPAFGLGLLVTSQWFVKAAAVAYATAVLQHSRGDDAVTMEGRHAVIYQSVLNAMRAVELTWSVLTESGQIAEVVVRQAYKAAVIYRLLDTGNWERGLDGTCDPTPPHSGGGHDEGGRALSALQRLPWSNSRRRGGDGAGGGDHAARTSRPVRSTTQPHDDLLLSSIAVRQLHFRYPATPAVEVFSPALNATLRLFDSASHRGRLVCITGRSGCGKSTLLALLLGLYDYTPCTDEDSIRANASDPGLTQPAPTATPLSPSSSIVFSFLPRDTGDSGADDGAVFDVGGDGIADGYAGRATPSRIPLSRIPRDVLRGRLFSYVPQQPTLLVGATLAHNITLASRLSLTSETLLAEARRCARLARCDFIDRLPQGLLTRVADGVTGGAESGDAIGDRPVRLSSGQGQRLMLARALYHGGTVLLMDEPTANLDRTTTDELLDEWQRLLRERVVHGIICCTHDEAVMRVADDVVAL